MAQSTSPADPETMRAHEEYNTQANASADGPPAEYVTLLSDEDWQSLKQMAQTFDQDIELFSKTQAGGANYQKPPDPNVIRVLPPRKHKEDVDATLDEENKYLAYLYTAALSRPINAAERDAAWQTWRTRVNAPGNRSRVWKMICGIFDEAVEIHEHGIRQDMLVRFDKLRLTRPRMPVSFRLKLAAAVLWNDKSVCDELLTESEVEAFATDPDAFAAEVKEQLLKERAELVREGLVDEEDDDATIWDGSGDEEDDGIHMLPPDTIPQPGQVNVQAALPTKATVKNAPGRTKDVTTKDVGGTKRKITQSSVQNEAEGEPVHATRRTTRAGRTTSTRNAQSKMEEEGTELPQKSQDPVAPDASTKAPRKSQSAPQKGQGTRSSSRISDLMAVKQTTEPSEEHHKSSAKSKAPRADSEDEDEDTDPENPKHHCPCNDQEKSNKMLCCDRCEQWWHFACAGYQRKPRKPKWLCDECRAPEGSNA